MVNPKLSLHQMDSLELEAEAPAVKALGSLFKLTEVHLWDDGWPEIPEPKLSIPQDVDGARSDNVSTTSDFSYLPEDVELTAQMNELGLPISFQTNKEKRNGMTRKNRKAACLKRSDCHQETKDEVVEFSKVGKVEIVFPTVFHDRTSNSLCSVSIQDKNESSHYDVAVDVSESKCPIGEGEDSASSGRISGATVKKQIGDGISGLASNDNHCFEVVLDGDDMSKDDLKTVVHSTKLHAGSPGCYLTDLDTHNDAEEISGHFMEYNCFEVASVAVCNKEGEKFCENNCTEQPLLLNSPVNSPSYEVAPCDTNHDEIGSYNCMDDFGDWKVYWDSFYMRNYFYNIKTLVSTWDPPPGMEHQAFVDITDKSNDMTAEETAMVVKPSIYCVCSKSADLYVSEINMESFEEPVAGSRLANQPLDKLTVECVDAVNNSISSITMPRISSTLDHLDEIRAINKSCSDSLCLLSDIEVHSHSQQNKVKELGLNELNIHMQCNYDTPFQVSDDISLTAKLTGAVSECGDIYLKQMDPAINKLDAELDPSTTKQKKKARRRRAQRKSYEIEEFQCQGLIEEFPPNISKYWCQRYLLFSRFDDGIRMDEEGWFSVTPESIARHHALRCSCGTIIDCFTGVGGNAIQFARRSKHVIAIDIDLKKIDYAYHNATIYGVVEQIDFIVGNFFSLAPTLKADTVFLSPPWGGPDYAKMKTYDIQTMLKPHNGYFLFDRAREIASRVVMFLPRNIDLNQLAELALSALPSWSLEVEKNFLNGKLKAITAYFNRMTVREQ